jgi:hypothetical protein
LLAATFPTRASSGDQDTFRDSVQSSGELIKQLGAALACALGRTIRYAEYVRAVPGPAASTVPIVVGPGAN